ncbi:FeoB small GTPase domain-containing protein [Desulfallas thermosapovorans]|uniref:Ferrous iron transport protein B n=1 Tax=Desulfallas thermosapovorans DSM 6562 TaxID=1121431 RepID=A0A5S4ZTH1_9FIRM|nr:FeoB small GTPase domain-containing protein [Desulfallas thermosapovorans]TYO95388.1 ferrous iron transport protein B [Desulfallas thermosapovorans DSM 6562]
MGLTYQSTGKLTSRVTLHTKSATYDYVIALAGNPNTGKSTLFNALTGLRQHTGNWPGKTVQRAEGTFQHNSRQYKIIDLPGTYSLLANSADEEVARDFICFARPDATIVVVDATCLERNLNLALQVMEITSKVVVCVNLIDEARRKKIRIDINKLSNRMGVPVVATAARSGEGLPRLLEAIEDVAGGCILPKPKLVRYGQMVEEAVAWLEPRVRDAVGEDINARWLALRLLDGDINLVKAMEKYLNDREAVTVIPVAREGWA